MFDRRLGRCAALCSRSRRNTTCFPQSGTRPTARSEPGSAPTHVSAGVFRRVACPPALSRRASEAPVMLAYITYLARKTGTIFREESREVETLDFSRLFASYRKKSRLISGVFAFSRLAFRHLILPNNSPKTDRDIAYNEACRAMSDIVTP